MLSYFDLVFPVLAAGWQQDLRLLSEHIQGMRRGIRDQVLLSPPIESKERKMHLTQAMWKPANQPSRTKVSLRLLPWRSGFLGDGGIVNASAGRVTKAWELN